MTVRLKKLEWVFKHHQAAPLGLLSLLPAHPPCWLSQLISTTTRPRFSHVGCSLSVIA